MSLRGKILAGFAAVLVMTAILGSTAIYLTSHMGSYSAEAGLIDNARSAILAGKAAYVTFTSNEDDAFAQEALNQMDEAVKFLQAAHDMDSNASNRAGLAKAISFTQKLHADIAAMLDRQHEANDLYARVTTDIDTLGADFTAVGSRMEARALDVKSTRAIENMALLAAGRNELAVSARAGVQAFTMFSSEETRQELLTGMQKTLDNLVSLSERAEVPANRAALLDLHDKTAAYIELAGQYLEVQGSVGVMQNEVSTEVASLLTQAEELSAIGIASVQNANNAANIISLVLMLVALIAGILIALYISGSVMRQLGADPGALASMAARVTNGDYDVDDGTPHRGVFDALIKMVDMLKQNIEAAHQQSAAAQEESAKANKAMEEAQKASEEAHAQRAAILAAADRLENVINVVSSASQELSAQIEQSGRGATEQAARVSETATAMDEMNTTVLEVARNAGQAAEFSGNTRQKAENGANVVHNVVASIQNVQAQSIQLKQDMGVLEERAQSINQIMAVISDIADQTNLLALNAAIEAARAGEAGRGFAVVADSVRNLAEKTMASATDVDAAIKAIQDSAIKSVSQLDSAVETINEATRLATESGTTLSEIVDMAEQTADQVRAIAAASEEQSASSEEITRSIDQISQISHETAEAMNQSAEAVSELARQAQELSTLVDEMKHA